MRAIDEQSLQIIKQVIDRSIKVGLFDKAEDVITVVNAYNQIVLSCEELNKTLAPSIVVPTKIEHEAFNNGTVN